MEGGTLAGPPGWGALWGEGATWRALLLVGLGASACMRRVWIVGGMGGGRMGGVSDCHLAAARMLRAQKAAYGWSSGVGRGGVGWKGWGRAHEGAGRGPGRRRPRRKTAAGASYAEASAIQLLRLAP